MPGLEAKTVLQHELTHHFMFQYFPAAYPSWYVEGFADYAGAIEIDDQNVARIGLFLPNRAQILRSMEWVPLKQLMNPDPRKNPFPRITIYSQGWITVHYLNRNAEGRKKLQDYLNALNKGASFGEAMTAFGDIDALDREVRAYARLSTLEASATQYLNLDPGPIEVSKLPPVQEALVEAQLSLSAGIAANRVQGFAREARNIASGYPDDPYAMRMSIEAERIAGNHAQALAVADRWLALQPDDPWANFFKGDMEAVALAEAKSTDAKAWENARARLTVAMTAQPNEPRFGRAFYESWLRTGALPPPIAQNALAHGLDLIPRESSLRAMVARDYEARGLIEDAINPIAPLAPLAYGIADESERDKRRRERAQEQYKTAEDEDEKETPREMLARLLQKKAEAPDETN